MPRTANALYARTIHDLDGIDAIGAEWRALECRCVGDLTYFQTFSWCRNWIAQFATGPRMRPHICTVWNGDRLVAVWPLMQVSGLLGVRRLKNLGDPHSQYANVLCDPALDAHDLAGLLIEGMAKDAACDVAVLNAVPRDSRLGAALTAKLPPAHARDEAAVLDLSRYACSDDYVAGLGKVQRRNRAKLRNALAKLGEVEFKVLWPGDPAYAEMLRACIAMKRRWLSERGIYSAGFAFSAYETFLAALEGDATSLSGACLSVLSCGGRPVAIELGFLRRNHYYSYIGAYDGERQHMSPGKVQMHLTVCWLIDQGVAAFDMLGNAADYKRSWANRSVPLRAHAIPFSWWGRLYAEGWLQRARPALKRLFGVMPSGVRGLMTMKQSLGCIVFFV